MTLLMPKLRSRDLPGVIDWIERVNVLFELGGDDAFAATGVAEEETGVATVVASGNLAAAGSIDLVSAGAQLLDVILICDTLDNPTYNGSGWATGSYAWLNYGYTTRWRWKQLDSLAAITRTGGTYHAEWMIVRGITSIAKVEDGDEVGTDEVSLNWPAPDAACIAQVAYLCDRDGVAQHPNVPTDWTSVSAHDDGTFTYDYHMQSMPVTGVVTWDGFGTSLAQIAIGFELRE